MIHGANGVCGPPRPSAAGMVGFALAAALALVLLARRARPRFILALVVVCALPGWWCLAVARADRPGHAADVAAGPRALAHAVERFAAANDGCVRVENRCENCASILRFALPSAPSCATTAPIVIAPDALERGCRSQNAELVCGGATP